MRLVAGLLAVMVWTGAAQAQLAPAQPADLADVLSRLQSFKPFAPADAAPLIASGAIARGDRLVSMQIRHTRTGTLRGDGAARSMSGQLDGMTLRSGSPVFMTSTTDGRRVWCGRAVANDWRGNCLIVNPQTRAPMWLGVTGWDNESIYFPRTYTGSHPLAEPYPTVEEGPVDFGVTMEMVWAFDRWTRKNAEITVQVRDSTGRRTRLQPLRVARADDGSARAEIAGGVLVLRPNGDGATVEVARSIDPKSEAAQLAAGG